MLCRNDSLSLVPSSAFILFHTRVFFDCSFIVALHFEVLIRESKTISDEFERASLIGEGTPQEISEFRENAFRNFIGRFYPIPYKITKGKVHDSFNREPSASVDCLIVNPSHPNLIDSQGKFQLLLADGIDVAIEVKPDIANSIELGRGLQQGVSVKKLRRIKSPILLEHSKPIHIIERSKQIPFFIFTLKTKKNIEELVTVISTWYKEHDISKEDEIDGICIHKVGFLRNIKSKEEFFYGWNIPEEDKTGWFFEEWNDGSLIGLLTHMELVFHSVATVQERIMQSYVKKIKIPNIRRINIY